MAYKFLRCNRLIDVENEGEKSLLGKDLQLLDSLLPVPCPIRLFTGN